MLLRWRKKERVCVCVCVTVRENIVCLTFWLFEWICTIMMKNRSVIAVLGCCLFWLQAVCRLSSVVGSLCFSVHQSFWDPESWNKQAVWNMFHMTPLPMKGNLFLNASFGVIWIYFSVKGQNELLNQLSNIANFVTRGRFYEFGKRISVMFMSGIKA